MKLQKHTASVVKGKEYSKWVLVIPSSQIEKLGWSEGAELESKVKKKKLIIERQINPPEKPKKMTYEEFRDSIEKLLKNKKKELTWTQIREELNLPQKVPNNLWVRTMERDIGLIRERIGTRTVWKLEM
jgi:bifunctional DNA-binding transcriptional regulator/antitoxin component of YhaV-PrlF toxin-antitoxin module